jgi:hypothetical protein
MLHNKISGKRSDVHLPFILMLFKNCVRFGISQEMIKSLSYNDLLALVMDFQIDEIEEHLKSKQGSKHQEKQYLDEEDIYKFHS